MLTLEENDNEGDENEVENDDPSFDDLLCAFEEMHEICKNC